jgi:hypothetical protein
MTIFVVSRKWLITKNMDITLESLITRIILHASLIRKNKEYDHSRVACAFEEIAAALNMVNQFRDAAKMIPTGAKSATPPKQKKCTFCGGAGWWLDAMGTNSYRCDECQNPAGSDHIVEANKMVPVVKDSLTTQIDTPRTDAASFSSRDPLELLQTSQQLERELNASQAEVERLKKELADWDYGTRAEREQKRAEKAEAEVKAIRAALGDDLLEWKISNCTLRAEVERLKEAMISCLHITNCYDGNYARACDNVELIVRNALK